MKSDTIYREDAVDAIVELCKHYTPTKSTSHPHVAFVIEELQRLPSAQPEMHGDVISRQAAIDAVEKESQVDGAYGYMDTKSIIDLLEDLPSAQPLSEIDLIELRDRFGEYVRYVVEDMLSGKGERWKNDK